MCVSFCPIVLCFLPCSVGSDAHPRSSLHGSPEHRPAPVAERGLGWRQQYCEWCSRSDTNCSHLLSQHSVTVRFSDCADSSEPYVSFAQRGETALHMAARAGQVEVVRCLLRNGAMVDARARVRLKNHICTRDKESLMFSFWWSLSSFSTARPV